MSTETHGQTDTVNDTAGGKKTQATGLETEDSDVGGGSSKSPAIREKVPAEE